MKFKSELIPGKLVKRYKRFLADVEMQDGEVITAHCANSGAMLGVKDPGLPVWLSPSPPESKGKLKYRWELVEVEGEKIGINTSHPNAIAEEAILADKIPDLIGYESLKREVKYGENSRIDIKLSDSAKSDCYVEVKNVHLVRQPGLVEFPDSVTARGTKHLIELSNMVKQGHRAVMLYVIQREDCSVFKLADDIDPAYAEAALQAQKAGVEFLAYKCHISIEEIFLTEQVTVNLND